MLTPPSALKRVLFIAGFLMFTCFIRPVFAEWEFQDSGTTQNLHDICFIDEYTGWAVGDNSTIIHTVDGGKTWVKQECPIVGLTLLKIECMGSTGICMGNGGPVLVTNNAGNQWIPHHEFKSKGYRGDVFLLNETHGWIAAQENSENKKYVYFTSDGGENWEMRSSYSLSIPALLFINEKTGWALHGPYIDNFDSTDVLFTEDGGESWSTVSRIDDSPNILTSVDGNNLWAGYSGFFVSSDGGINWRELGYNGLSDYFIRGFYPITYNLIYLFAYKENGYDLLLYNKYTESYEILSRINKDETSFFFESMCGVNTNMLWMAGGDGKIIKYIHTSSVQIETGILPDTIILDQNKPNPFNSATHISFSIAKPETVDLSIYSVTGQKICTLVSEQMQSGTYSYIWEGYDERKNCVASTGVYFYVLDVNCIRKTGKMLLLK